MAITHDNPAPPVIRGEFERWEQAHYVTRTQDPINPSLGDFPPAAWGPAGRSAFLVPRRTPGRRAPVRRDRLRQGGLNLDSGGGRQ
ncbi:hypothetical protein [Streptomyces sp. NBC_00878]|uniref:hypothetical protein n=1 Tax=Streptomyces sp. NBC_00878 TaxID=2975854 RepID=UPI00224E2CF9|nr:hypothetical protein [Streptomyces sp. NBC_00878]MCX4903463.1 hypothetical protein [Streptomyces sp. NBC_00878]